MFHIGVLSLLVGDDSNLLWNFFYMPRLHSSRRHCFFHTHILILWITHQLQFAQGRRYFKAPIAATNASLGALKVIWSNPYLGTYNKNFTVPSNTDEPPPFGLQSLLGKLEVFLHKSICCILKLSMFWVINKKLRNEQVRTSFFAMPCVKNMIAARQLDYSGKLIRGPHDQPARRMITSCCNET